MVEGPRPSKGVAFVCLLEDGDSVSYDADREQYIVNHGARVRDPAGLPTILERAAQRRRVRTGEENPQRTTTPAARGALLGANPQRWLYISSTTIAQSKGKPGDDPFLRAVAELAYSKDGPLGPSGLFSDLGVLRNNPLHPSYWIKFWTQVFEPYARAVAKDPGSPVGALGPLGEGGPTNRALFEALLRPWLGSLAEELEPGGMLGGVGNGSALGAGSVTGPGGQLGGTGDTQDAKGRFHDAKGGVERTISVPWSDGEHKIELTEMYDAKYAAHMKNNDTSWCVASHVKGLGDSSPAFPFTSHKSQWVSISVAHRPGDSFELILEDKNGRVLKTSHEVDEENMMQFQVPEGQELKVKVRLQKTQSLGEALLSDPIGAYARTVLFPWGAFEALSTQKDEHPYFLIVAGSGSLEGSTRGGPHQEEIKY